MSAIQDSVAAFLAGFVFTTTVLARIKSCVAVCNTVTPKTRRAVAIRYPAYLGARQILAGTLAASIQRFAAISDTVTACALFVVAAAHTALVEDYSA